MGLNGETEETDGVLTVTLTGITNLEALEVREFGTLIGQVDEVHLDHGNSSTVAITLILSSAGLKAALAYLMRNRSRTNFKQTVTVASPNGSQVTKTVEYSFSESEIGEASARELSRILETLNKTPELPSSVPNGD